MITINNVSAEEFKISQENFSSSNFLQSAEMASLQLTRKNFLDTELLLIKNNDTIIGQAIINYKLKRKIFKEAIIVQGPVFNYQNLFEVEQAFKSLLNYLSKKGIYKLTVQPYVFPRKQYTRLKTTLENLGFQNKYNPENMEFGFSQIFLKNITQIKNEQELFNSFSGNIQRDIKKFTEMGVIVDELKYKNLNIFYNILKKNQ
uniref:peptidoglycan bridge formation glycyltransferase FemA/FemB family protein n=1 Tax=Streptococcus uberis TaxID=1349 RepID=UPI0027DE0068|nr:peptidoglycan bridge formation glycyltransferase FemA/FemB family protein [Streptococcus uberis]